MQITVGKKTVLIDAEDVVFLKGWSKKIKDGYLELRRNGKTWKGVKAPRFARMVMNAEHGVFVDHINHNTLDNRKCNLRLCNRSENARNNQGHSNRTGSKYKGVVYHDARKYGKDKKLSPRPWRAYTRIEGKRLWFGYYATEIDAAMAYNRNALKLFGEFACFNRLENCPVVEGLG